MGHREGSGQVVVVLYVSRSEELTGLKKAALREHLKKKKNVCSCLP